MVEDRDRLRSSIHKFPGVLYGRPVTFIETRAEFEEGFKYPKETNHIAS